MDFRICFVTYGLQMYDILLFDNEVPLVVQGIALMPHKFFKSMGRPESLGKTDY